ncbi:hypothetical protein [Romboutsia sp. 1001713B170131_170501_G6]|uniref:hypothetical protein n=1 Tax=Romboutsia sp. 1001713B170131_170501_G6 TaxID=2787108 RepID=UPI0018AA02D5|nr:hypothetical protein [Romboutsia sp. 1001713B170131_170501_G6]
MKRAITALSVLCGGMLFMSPINNIIFAQNSNKKPTTEVVENINNNTKEEVTKQENKNNVQKEVKKVEKQEIVTNNKVNNQKDYIDKKQSKVDKKENVVTKEENKTTEKNQVVEKPQVVEDNKVQDNKVQEENKIVSNDKVQADIKEESKVEVIEILNKEQAKELIQMYNQGVNYTYEGDENNFNALKEKGLSGYVFFPDYDTDLGFFVDKNTSNIYYFHPSGYLKLAI